MTCPSCGDPDAYVGLSVVSCPNSACPHFDWDAMRPNARTDESELERIRRELAEAPDWACYIPWP